VKLHLARDDVPPLIPDDEGLPARRTRRWVQIVGLQVGGPV
jgi:hypothetical protein